MIYQELIPSNGGVRLGKTKVYLAGPIHGRTDSQAMDWRQWVTSRLNLASDFTVLDPMRRDYRGKEAENVNEIVDGDLTDIGGADVIVVNAETPSWGTAMEIVYAHRYGKQIIVVGPSITSPWLIYHSTNRVETMGEAVRLLNERRVQLYNILGRTRGAA